jgi:sugar O-acyltransferase (sialic acid O-acetyltransferase NeuD family)
VTAMVVIYGAGGHGKVVAEILLACRQTLAGFIDDDIGRSASTVLALPVFGAFEWLSAHPGAQVGLGIGENHAREQAALRVQESGSMLLTLVHPSAVVARSARIDRGAVIMAAAVLNADCVIGEGAIVNTGAIVEHDVQVGGYAHLSPGSTIGGAAQIGAYAHIGIGATVLPRKHVGNNCMIGAGAVVVDIADGQTAYGVPAKVRVRL